MGWHCDSKFSVKGKFLDNMNGQVYNTPVVIFSIGKSRYLKWRRRFVQKNLNGRNEFVIESKSLEEMLLTEGSVCIINPRDEEPHIDELLKRMVHFQHGDTKVIGNDISIGFVFRVSPHSCVCSKHDNRVILPENVINIIKSKEKGKKVNQEERNKLYNKFDMLEYHNILKSHFLKYYNI